ncbi:leucine-rich repeat-containing protein 10B [Protopterus annectens]|uniref:leucine-rich repeat-containing protein 10B n=1 Tax=Protopterus annectens TaxID=7888 RepID=UPI001CFA3141|nr:leucine-rich repeat-containing protein 10B [Protopterus annectens]
MKMGNAAQACGSGQAVHLPPEVEELLRTDNILDLSYKKMKVMPAEFCCFSQLEKLYISNNHIRELPDEFAELTNLRILALDFNKFEEVPKVVCQLENLTRLYMGNNRLMTIPPEFRNLQSLRCLWIENNYFRKFPKQLVDLRNLKSVQMGDNRLKSLPEDLARMTNLRGLWLYSNRLEDLPKVLLKMEFLEILDVDKNKITTFPNMVHLTRLKLFCYDHNPAKIPPKVANTVTLVGEGAEEIMATRAEQKQEEQEKESESVQGILKNGSMNDEDREAFPELDYSPGDT